MGCVRHSGCRPFGFDLGSDCYNSMKGGTENEIDLEVLGTRLRKMNDQELRRFGLAARFMCSAGAKLGKPPRQVLVIQLEEARAELERRNSRKGT
jgi:hypothetical protein